MINKATLAQWRSAGLTAAIGETWVKPEDGPAKSGYHQLIDGLSHDL